MCWDTGTHGTDVNKTPQSLILQKDARLTLIPLEGNCSFFAAESSRNRPDLCLQVYCQDFEPFEPAQFVSNPASIKQSYFDGSSFSSKNSP